ncbi:hypothetical protein ASZ90_004727 [hydrocarbon metagenome]|uniref:Uncharacterized protein n=1 Tax=hydrocarbon metagenome TaxID=938273 RepID=A0A0W8FX17_9ZZZZ
MRTAKIHILLILLVLLSTISLSGNDNSNSHKSFLEAGISIDKLKTIDSELRKLVLNQIKNTKHSFSTSNNFAGKPVYKLKDGQAYISVFLKSNSPELTKIQIETSGGTVSNVIKNILIADLPINNILDIVFDQSIQRVETAKYQESLLDTSLTFIKVEKVHNGLDLPKEFKGEGVVVGVLDTGIDWTHPAFSNESGNRILYLWDMSDDANPPAEFDYGTEYTKADLDQQNSNQIDDHGHGTHVASTAAGNAGGEEYPLVGVAPEADIVFVKGFRAGVQTFADTDIINGCDYIFKKADQLGKSAVVNLSLGSVNGDIGNSLYEQALTNLVDAGKLIVASAGNSGSSNIHLSYEMSGSSLEERSETYWRESVVSRRKTYISGYPKSENFTFGIKVYSEDFSELYYTSPEVSYNEMEANVTVTVNNDTLGTLKLDGIPQANEKYIFDIEFEYPENSDFSKYYFSLFTYGSGEFHAWIENGEFSTISDPANNIFAGDKYMTIGYPSTAFNVFSIGAFTTRTSWVNFNGTPYSVNGTLTDRAYFSSIGPTRDGRVKPDFSAPGHWIAAGYSKDANLNPATILDEKTVLMQGTSMSAPHFTGVVALLLEQNPNLTYDEVFEVLKNTAIADDITRAVPNNEFGYGRIDVHAALQSIITSVDDNSVPVEYNLSQNYPNPFNPSTTLSFSIPKQTYVSLKVYDVLGKEVTELVNEEKSAGNYKIDFDASNLSSGIYIYTLKSNEFIKARKMMLIK